MNSAKSLTAETTAPGRKRNARRSNAAPTITDVAREAKCSPMTVSRVINRSPLLNGATRDKVEAVIEAAVLRLRPILMTTGAMVLGAVPLAVATGAGSESRHEIGWALVGGMTFGTAFTLFIVPAFYTLLSRRKPEPAAHAAPDGVAVPAE